MKIAQVEETAGRINLHKLIQKKTLRVFYGGLNKNRRAQHASSEAGGKGKYGTVKKGFGISFVGKRFQEDVIKPEKM